MPESRLAPPARARIGLRSILLLDSVARLGSIQRAAAVCGLSQPGANQALSLLQQRIGAPLLERSFTGSRLTAAGEAFMAVAGRGLDDCRAAIGQLGIAEPDAALRMLTGPQLGLLSLILQTGSLEGAAQAAGISRLGARRSVAAIEQHLGPLLERTGQGRRLTARAAACARSLADTLTAIERAGRQARARREDVEQTIVVGAAQAFGNRFLAKVLSELAAGHPQARITVLRESPAELVGRLRAGEVDLVVGDVEEAGADLVRSRLVVTPYFVFARPGHPLTRSPAITVEDLAGYDWVGGTPGSAREQALARLFGELPLPRRAFAASEGAVVGHFVAGSDRLALMTEHESRCGGLALGKLPLPALESGLGIDVVRLSERTPSLLHEELVQLLRAHLSPASQPAMPGRRVA